ncbi:TlyA family RNA methyltransferase [Micrococcoides hystricis]|uniref:TlyA family RNA methyltransferase n=1 Tax=Micrococcoides hystricis TaxID=1572761 RepID=A0ABV6P6L3_9MICC
MSGPGRQTQRLDQHLVHMGVVPSRTKAATLIQTGSVLVNGSVQTKPAHKVAETDAVEVRDGGDKYVSRAGHKLAGALARFPDINVHGKMCLDAGASTGGFTQVLLEAGAAGVYAVDVGHGQLVQQLRDDDRVHVYEKLNIRDIHTILDPESVPLIVSDLSFISLTLVIPALSAVAAPGADLLLMVKPQFEVGKSNVGKAGVVTDPRLRRDAVTRVVDCAAEHQLCLQGVDRSSLPGQDGNVEFFCWFTSGARESTPQQDSSTLLAAVDYA